LASEVLSPVTDLFPSLKSQNVKTITIKIDGKEFFAFNNVVVTTTLDAITQVEFGCVIPKEGSDFYEALLPFSNASIVVEMEGEPFMTGYIRSAIPEASKDSRSLRVTAVDAPGILAESHPPEGMPLKFTNDSFASILSEVCFAYDLTLGFDSKSSTYFPGEVKFEVSETPWAKLVELAKKGGLFLRSVNGALSAFHFDDSNPSLFTGGGHNIDTSKQGPIEYSVDMTDSEFFSSVGVKRQVSTGRKGKRKHKSDGGSFVVKNPWASSALTKVAWFQEDIKASATSTRDAEDVATDKMARMIGSSISWNFTMPTWRFSDGDMFEIGKVVFAYAPQVWLKRLTALVVDKVEFNVSKEAKSAKVTLKLPCTYTGELPTGEPPWKQGSNSLMDLVKKGVDSI
jgi:prophage tail gpP-like protein